MNEENQNYKNLLELGIDKEKIKCIDSVIAIFGNKYYYTATMKFNEIIDFINYINKLKEKIFCLYDIISDNTGIYVCGVVISVNKRTFLSEFYIKNKNETYNN